MKDYLLTIENLALMPKPDKSKPNIQCAFSLNLNIEPFLGLRYGDESYKGTAFVSVELKRFWQYQDRWDQTAMFSITSEAGKITRYTTCI